MIKLKTFIDLFSGIGGFHVALHRRGLTCVFASDIDSEACKSYEANFGLKPHGDITQIDACDIPAHDVLCAGFPCQPFSRSGNKEGMNDSRGGLFYEIVRIADHHRPKVLILENVKAILTMDGGKVKHKIYEMLDKIGYHTSHEMLNASDCGIPQSRERVYFVAIRKDAGLLFTPHLPFQNETIVKDIILPDIDTKSLVINRSDTYFDKNKNPQIQARPLRIGYIDRIMQGYRIYSTNGHAVTQTANGGGLGRSTGLYLINNEVRRLHIDEMKRVMGFDITHIVSDGSNGYKQLGNSIVPSVVGAVFDGISATTPRRDAEDNR